eukprot:1313165-Rhodomonas_salina.1
MSNLVQGLECCVFWSGAGASVSRSGMLQAVLYGTPFTWRGYIGVAIWVRSLAIWTLSWLYGTERVAIWQVHLQQQALPAPHARGGHREGL